MISNSLLERVKSSTLIEDEQVVCLCGLGQSSPYELTFGVELDPPMSYLYTVSNPSLIPFGLSVHTPVKSGREGVKSLKLVRELTCDLLVWTWEFTTLELVFGVKLGPSAISL